MYRPLLGDTTGRMIQRDHGYLEYRFGPAHTCEIVNIEVEAEHRGQGIGTEMLASLVWQAEERAQTIYAFTDGDNILAHRWYRKQGFRLIDLPHFYPDRPKACICIWNR
jgi:ribosomal protein S18 acetylase RimI-like enzyme